MLKFHSCLAQKRSAKIRIDAESYQTIEPELIPEKSYKRWKSYSTYIFYNVGNRILHI